VWTRQCWQPKMDDKALEQRSVEEWNQAPKR